jgi:3-oxoadipate enol-lactonase
MWAGQRSVVEGRRVVAVDHPGHGGAPATGSRDLGELGQRVLRKVGEGTFSFVGLSLGGAIGMQLALDAPDRVERLVLACTAARFGDPAQWIERAALVRASGMTAIADAVVARWFTPEFEDTGRFREMLASTDAEAYARCCEALAAWDVRDELHRVEAPTLVISGAEDPSTPPEQGELIASRVPEARHAVIPRAAHLVNVERASEFNQLLEGHL